MIFLQEVRDPGSGQEKPPRRKELPRQPRRLHGRAPRDGRTERFLCLVHLSGKTQYRADGRTNRSGTSRHTRPGLRDPFDVPRQRLRRYIL
ncbi:hypothetical protein D3C87_1832690 [compost metagenome]